MYHKIDEKYGVKCYNIPIIEGIYLENGYTNNILSVFKKYPKGYFLYFKEILEKDMKGVKFKKRFYALKHFILFKELCGYRFVRIRKFSNEVLYLILLIPGKIITKIKIKSFNKK